MNTALLVIDVQRGLLDHENVTLSDLTSLGPMIFAVPTSRIAFR